MAEKKEVLEKLTDEQMKLIPVVRDEWLNKFLSFQYDGDKAMKLIEYIYELSELKMPKVVECESPMDCQIAANLWPTEYKDAKERKKAMGKKKVEYVPFSFYGFSFDYGWCAFYDFFRRIGIVKHEKFEKYLTLIDCNIFIAIYLKDVAFICKPPKYMHRDEQGRLSWKQGPSVEFTDGYGVYTVKGVRFKKDPYVKAFLDNKFTATDILKTSNAEQRAVLIEHYGYEYILADPSIQPKVRDKYDGESKSTHKPVHYELVDFKIDNLNVRVVRVEDHTTHKVTTLGVPVSKETETCMGAIAWTFGKTEKEYNPDWEG